MACANDNYPVSKRYGTNKGLIWDFIWVLLGIPYGTGMGFATRFYVVPTWANPYGSQMGTIWAYSGFGPSGPCPANLCRIDF